MEELEFKEKVYRTQIAEQKERKPTKLVADIKAMSKEEYEKL